MSEAAVFPPILVDARGWEYTQQVQELGNVNEKENFIIYLLRVIWAIVSCVICSTGCPPVERKRQIIHKIIDTFRCKANHQPTTMELDRIQDYLNAPLVAARRNVEMAAFTGGRVCRTLSSERTVVNWGAEITDCQIQADGRFLFFDKGAKPTTSMGHDYDLAFPSNGTNTMQIQMYEGARFVLSRDHLWGKSSLHPIQQYQLCSLCLWLGIGVRESGGWALQKFLNDLLTQGTILDLNDIIGAGCTENQLVGISGSGRKFARNIRLPSYDGYWTVELSRGPNRSATITTDLKPIHRNAVEPLKTWLALRNINFPCLKPFVDVATGRVGYTICRR